ncbi:hypothetical protein LX36DRAFT_436909 [Colletotrichum falcatum]|nr:hypothetical protein LX36DRAFT_436909 [Colletotrichum falcatum]
MAGQGDARGGCWLDEMKGRVLQPWKTAGGCCVLCEERKGRGFGLVCLFGRLGMSSVQCRSLEEACRSNNVHLHTHTHTHTSTLTLLALHYFVGGQGKSQEEKPPVAPHVADGTVQRHTERGGSHPLLFFFCLWLTNPLEPLLCGWGSDRHQ